MTSDGEPDRCSVAFRQNVVLQSECRLANAARFRHQTGKGQEVVVSGRSSQHSAPYGWGPELGHSAASGNEFFGRRRRSAGPCTEQSQGLLAKTQLLGTMNDNSTVDLKCRSKFQFFSQSDRCTKAPGADCQISGLPVDPVEGSRNGCGTASKIVGNKHVPQPAVPEKTDSRLSKHFAAEDA